MTLRPHRSLPRRHDFLVLALATLGTRRLALLFRQRQLPNSGDHSGQHHRELGRAYEAMGDSARAEHTLRAAVTARPADWSMYNALGAFYARLRRYDEAATQFERVVALTPDNARGHSNLGAMYTQLRDWPRAFASLEKATALGPNDRTWSNLATAYFRRGRYQDAAAAFERAISLGATNYQVWANLASAWYWVPGKESRSQEAYTRAVELGEAERRVNPRQPALLGRLAECYAHLNNRRLAESLAAEAEALAPKDARVWLQTAQAFEQLGDRAGALRRIETSFKLGLSKEEVESSRTLDALRKDPAVRISAAVTDPGVRLPRYTGLDVRQLHALGIEAHQVLAPDHLAFEHLLDLVDDLLADAGLIDLREQVRQHQRLHAGAFGDDRVVAVVAARGAIGRRRLGAAEVVVHVDQQVAALGQLDDRVAGAAVAGVADRALLRVDAGRRGTPDTAARAGRGRP